MANITVEFHEDVLVITMRDGSQHVKVGQELERDTSGFRGVVAHSHLLYDATGGRIEQRQISGWMVFHDVWVATATNSQFFERAIGSTDTEATNNLHERMKVYAQSNKNQEERQG